jgi:hypothetical protein
MDGPEIRAKKAILGRVSHWCQGLSLGFSERFGSGSRERLHTESLCASQLSWLPGRDIKQEFPWWLRPITVSSFNLEKVELPARNGAYQGFKMALGAARTASVSTGRPAPLAGPSYPTSSASCSHPATLKSKAPSVPST